MDIDTITPSVQRPFLPYQKTIFSFILSLFLFSAIVEAQTAPAWVRTLDSDSYNAGSDVAVAPTGDVYFSGVFEGQLFNVESKGSTDIWLTKVSSSGETEWITIMHLEAAIVKMKNTLTRSIRHWREQWIDRKRDGARKAKEVNIFEPEPIFLLEDEWLEPPAPTSPYAEFFEPDKEAPLWKGVRDDARDLV